MKRHGTLSPDPRETRQDSAFTLAEFLVVLGVLALFTFTLLPALARTKGDSRAFQCLNNTRELTRAWRMWTDDNQDQLLYSSGLSSAPASDARTWVFGDVDFNGANRATWDVNYAIAKSPLWPYCGTNAGIWRCPADGSYVQTVAGIKPRVRTYAMNYYLGGYGGTDGGWGPPFSNFRIYLKYAEILNPTPARLFVFTEFRPDAIVWSEFLTAMDGYPSNPALFQLSDLPGCSHDGAAGFSFADGHGELHRWKDRRTTTPPGMGPPSTSASPNNPDIAWLQDHATRPK